MHLLKKILRIVKIDSNVFAEIEKEKSSLFQGFIIVLLTAFSISELKFCSEFWASNIKSFSFRVQYNEVFLDYGSFYAPGLNDLGFLIKTNNQGSTILVAAACTT